MAHARKTCILGDFAVGKTSLVRRYVLNEFSHDYKATIGVNVYKFSDQLDTGDGTCLEQIIWDIEGSGLSRELLGNYIEGASGALVVGDVARADALSSMTDHARLFQERLPGRPVVFAFNKVDLIAPHQWPSGDPLAAEFGTNVVYTSAATGSAVPELFRTLGRSMLQVDA